MILNPIKHLKYNFTFDFFQKRLINPFYECLVNLTNNKEVLNTSFKTTDRNSNAIHEVKFIPLFFGLNTDNLDIDYKVIKYKRIDNFLIDLKGYPSANEYLENVMTRKHRKQIRTKNRRLDTCFKISYRTYFGNISELDYNFLFDELQKLIERRFKQRDDKFFLSDKWDILIKETYPLILDKRASFFVIFDDDKPISISLNYHFENIMQSFISSYDIDYAKFGIGHITILKKIEWCLANNFRILDLMWGKVPHKELWCNSISKYEHHLIYLNNQILQIAYVKLLVILYKIKDSSMLSKISKSYKNIKKYFALGFSKSSTIKELNYKIVSILEKPLKDNLTKINMHSSDFEFLRKPVYDFQYLNSETSDNVHVFKENTNDNSYLIVGPKSQIKVFINHN